MESNAAGLCPTCNAQPCVCAYVKDPNWLTEILAELDAAGQRSELPPAEAERVGPWPGHEYPADEPAFNSPRQWWEDWR